MKKERRVVHAQGSARSQLVRRTAVAVCQLHEHVVRGV
jgi:hypothetical protein